MFVVFITTISCKKISGDSSRIVVIEGKVNPSLTRTHTIYFYRYTDSLSLFFCEKTLTDSCELKPDGSFKLEISNWNKSGFFDLGFKELVFARNYFLQLGDELNLQFEGNEIPPTLNLSGRVGKYNLFLQIFNDTFYRNKSVKDVYYKSSNFLLAPDYATYINNRRLEEINFYKKYFSGQEIDSVFNYYFEKETNYNWANDKVYFLWKKRIRKEEVPIESSYFDFLKIVKDDDPSALICPGYTRFISLYIRELIQEESINYANGITPSIEKCNLAKSKLKGIGLRIALYNLIRDELYSVDAPLGNVQHDSVIQSMVQIGMSATNDSSFYYFARSKGKTINKK